MAGEKNEAEVRILAEKVARNLESKGLKRGSAEFNKAFAGVARDLRTVGKNISETGTYTRPVKPKTPKATPSKAAAAKKTTGATNPILNRKYVAGRPATRGTSGKKSR